MLSGATSLVSSGNNISSRGSPTLKARRILKRDKRPRPVLVCCFRALLLMTSKADKLPLETEPVANDNNTILALKPGDQTLSRLTQLIIVVLSWNSFYVYRRGTPGCPLVFWPLGQNPTGAIKYWPCRRLALLVEILANKFCPSAVVPALQSIWFYNP